MRPGYRLRATQGSLPCHPGVAVISPRGRRRATEDHCRTTQGHRCATQRSQLCHLARHLLGYFATRDLLGRGVKRPHVITRERMAAERRPMRRSKALDETILKHPLNFPNEVTCQVKVRSKVKIGAFRLRAIETSKLPVLGQNLLRVLLKYRARH